MLFPHLLFKKAGLNATDIASICGVSRITGYRWLRGTGRKGTDGAGVNLFLRDRVKDAAYAVKAAVDAGELPNEAVSKLAPSERASKLSDILNQYHPEK